MKLRQKLAVALATAMVVTAVPVVTMADSTNNITKVVTVAEKTAINDATTAPQLKVELDDYDKNSTKEEVFYLQLENATWNYDKETGKLQSNGADWVNTDANFNVTVISDTEAKVVVEKGVQSLNAIRIPLLTTVKSGDAKVSIVNKGNTTVSKGSYVFATTNEKLAVVTVGDTTPTLYKEGKIADIILTEAYEGSFASLTDNTIELTIQNSDFIFDDVTGTVKLEYGFAGNNNTVPAIADVVAVDSKDEQVLRITLPKDLAFDSIGQIRIQGLKVKSTSKTPETGDLTIDITGKATKDQTDVKVAKIAEYSNTLSVKDDKAVEIVAGQSKAVEFTLAENVEDSMIANREVEFKLDKGYFALEADSKKDSETEANLIANINSIKNGKTELSSEEIKNAIVDVTVEDGKVIGFTMKMPATATTLDKFIINADVFVGLEESGDITLTAEGRAIDKALSVVVADAKQSIEVTTEVAVLKVGLKGQEAGKITITETEKEMIKKGQNIEIVLPAEKGITFAEAPEVKVTGDIQVGKVTIQDITEDGKVTGQKVVVPVTRASKTASTIEIANFVIDTDRTVAEGAYDVKIGGAALTANKDSITAEKFITIGTPNTEDLGSNGLRKGTSTFVIGESKYTVNGVEKEMDAKSFIQDPGYTMVPVRYVAEAFGVEGNNILFSNGVATIFAGTRTIQLTNNSDIAVVNGAQIKMATKVVMKDGRTYAPIGEVAQLLGVAKAWDNTTKTATFTNK